MIIIPTESEIRTILSISPVNSLGRTGFQEAKAKQTYEIVTKRQDDSKAR